MLVAHATAVVLKRIVRRARPLDERVVVHRQTASPLSFPSAHMASTTAAALALRPLVGDGALVAPVLMGVARMRLGLHYPSDVLAGAALGIAAVLLVRPRA